MHLNVTVLKCGAALGGRRGRRQALAGNRQGGCWWAAAKALAPSRSVKEKGTLRVYKAWR